MYKQLEITSLSEGCAVMSGNPERWIDWAIDSNISRHLLICNSDGDPIYIGKEWQKYHDLLYYLVDVEKYPYAMIERSLFDNIAWLLSADLKVIKANRVDWTYLYSHSTGAALWHIAKDLGDKVGVHPIRDQRCTGDDICVFSLIGELEFPVLWDIEAYYYDFLTEVTIGDMDFMACIPTYILEMTEDSVGVAVTNYLHETNQLDEDEELIERPDGGFNIGMLMGINAVHNAIRGYLECMESDMSIMDSDVCYAIGDVIYNLQNGDYRFDIDGNMIG